MLEYCCWPVHRRTPAGAVLHTTGGVTNLNTNAAHTGTVKNLSIRVSNTGSRVNFRSSQRLKSLIVDNGGLAHLTDGGGKKLWLDGLQIDLNPAYLSRLDLGNGLLIWDYTNQSDPSESVRQMLYPNRWIPNANTVLPGTLSPLGPGIMSSTVRAEAAHSTPFTALSWINNANRPAQYTHVKANNRLTTTSSGDEPIPSSVILVNFDVIGNTDLGGTGSLVDANDQIRIASPNTPGTWSTGDFDYNGQVDATQIGWSTGNTNQNPWYGTTHVLKVLDAALSPVNRGEVLRFSVHAVDSSIKRFSETVNGLTYSFNGTPPSGATIDTATGDVTWPVPVNYPVGNASFPLKVTQTGGGTAVANATINVQVGQPEIYTESGDFDITPANGTTFDGQMKLWYSIANGPSAPFNVAIYASSVQSPDASTLGDRLMTFRVDNPDDLNTNLHSITFRPDFVDLPKDYYLVARLDADGEVNESNETTNQVSFTGRVFVTTDGTVHVHGTDRRGYRHLSGRKPCAGHYHCRNCPFTATGCSH